MPGIYRLKGTVKHFDWGGIFFIPSLLNLDNADHRPFAEYWMGAHRQDHCMIDLSAGDEVLLREYLAKNPSLLGKEVQQRFGQLPYLLKLLDVHQMLSIQVHPSKTAAEKEFARENAEGIPHNSPQRNYKDDNHKPELLVAMGDFWLLHGFKPADKLRNILRSVPELVSLLSLFENSGYEGLYKKVMTMPQQDVNRMLEPLLDRIVPLYEEDKLNRTQEDFWAARAALNFPGQDKVDRGIFSIYFFNLVQLKKGEGIFQEAGVPHAYLEGQNVEIMANSDNVLRGGLTRKHIDVTEVLKHVKCEATEVGIIKGRLAGEKEKKYESTAPDFQLSAFELKAGDETFFTPVTAEIIVLTEGSVELNDGSATINLQAGSPSAIAFPGHPIRLNTAAGALVFRASVPVHNSE